MGENLQYEDEMNRRFDDDLPLPDMEQSWQKMKQKLDEDKKRRIPPFLLTGCLVGVLLIGIVALVWFFGKGGSNDKQTANNVTSINKKQQLAKKSETGTEQQAKVTEGNAGTVTPSETEQTGEATELPHKNGEKNKGVVQQEVAVKRSLRKATGSTVITYPQEGAATLVKRTVKVNRRSVIKTALANTSKSSMPKTNKGRAKRERSSGALAALEPTTTIEKRNETIDTNANNKRTSSRSDSLITKNTTPQSVKDSASSKAGLSAKSKATETNTNERKRLYWAAGLAMQQQIPLKGQKAVPYNAYGRSSSLADYIPSIYLRLYHPKKWFLQTEFRYGAPQTTKQFTYNQARVDSLGATVTRRYSSLKKTYYHQLPVSFNYFVLPNLSVGVGAMYSKFYGAVSEEGTKTIDLITGTETVLDKKVVRVPNNTDSFFTKTQWSGILEAQYQWKRLSLGLRYTKGLQPYIRYKNNSGEQKSEKNQSLQAFIRYELWRSGKRK